MHAAFRVESLEVQGIGFGFRDNYGSRSILLVQRAGGLIISP